MDETRHCNVTTTLEKRIRPLVLYLCQKVLYETGGDHRQTVWHHPMSLDYCCVLLRWTCSILRSFSWASVTSPAMSVRYKINVFRDEDAEHMKSPNSIGCPPSLHSFPIKFPYNHCITFKFSLRKIHPSSMTEICCLRYHRSVFDNSSCLLYTSPSPRDATLSRMPSSA